MKRLGPLPYSVNSSRCLMGASAATVGLSEDNAKARMAMMRRVKCMGGFKRCGGLGPDLTNGPPSWAGIAEAEGIETPGQPTETFRLRHSLAATGDRMVSEIMGPSFVQGRREGSPTATVLGMLFLVRKEGEEKPSKGAAPSTLTSSAPFPARHRNLAIPQSSDRRQSELKRFN